MAHPRRRVRRARGFPGAIAAAAVLAVVASGGSAAAHESHTTTLDGADTVEAAIELSRFAYPGGLLGGALDGVGEVLLGRADLFSDTLAAGSATGRPVLLTPSDRLDERTADELDRLGAERVTLLGGREALSENVAAALAERGYEVGRLSGATRVQTALAIARRHHPDASDAPVVLARADGTGTRAFADALGGSALAHALEAPVLLTPTDRLHEDVAAYLAEAGARELILAGGEAAISRRVTEQLAARGLAVRRAGGSSRSGTATAQNVRRGLSTAHAAETVLLLAGYHEEAWASGFAAGAWAGTGDVAVMLATGDRLDGDSSAFVGAAAATDLVCAARVSSSACRAAERAMDLPPFAATDGIALRQLSTGVELVDYHEANHDGAQQLDPLPTGPPSTTLDSRGRDTGSRSAAHGVAHPHPPGRSPVTGTVLRTGTYQLYCRYRDDFAVIEPDAHPGWEVKLLHIDGVRVTAGEQVHAGTTVLAPRPTALPLESQVDDASADRDWPHVHLEVVDPSVPNESSGSC
jgi:putative cell wall-binding protein